MFSFAQAAHRQIDKQEIIPIGGPVRNASTHNTAVFFSSFPENRNQPLMERADYGPSLLAPFSGSRITTI